MLPERIKQYITDHTSAEIPVLTELYRATHLECLNPQMASGHQQGVLLQLLSNMLRPNRVLEIGTFTGYSAICLALGMPEGGLLHTIEANDEIADIGARFFEKAGLANKIIQHTGNALEIIPTLHEIFDLVFIDGEKTEYPAYYRLVKPLVRPGGFILADNVLWDGKAASPALPGDVATQAIQEFNHLVTNDPEVMQTILPVRDGISLIRLLGC